MQITYRHSRFEAEIPQDQIDKWKDQFKLYRWNYDLFNYLWYTVDPDLLQPLLPYLDAEAEANMYRLRAEELQTYHASMKLDSDLDVPCPEGKRYYRFQRACVEFAKMVLFRDTTKDSTGILIGDEQGVGKTMETTGIVNYLTEVRKHHAPRILCVCQGHMRKMWATQLGCWLLDEHGVAIATPQSGWPTYAQVVILSYEALNDFYDELRQRPWDVWIADEVQMACNHRAQRTQLMFGNNVDLDSIPARYAIFLSGTPFKNRPKELFPILHYLDPVRWPSMIEFGKRYCDGFQTKSGKWDFNGESSLEELQVKLRSTIMIRRMKKDVLPFLPPKYRQIVELPAGEEAVSAIKEELDAWRSYQNKMAEAKNAVAAAKDLEDDTSYKNALRKLRYTVTVGFSEMSKFRHKTAIAKIPYILAQLEELIAEVGPKVIVFAHHHVMIEAIAKKYPNHAIAYGGNLQKRDPYDEEQRFQNDPDVGPFICSIKKGTGMTLTASCTELFAELDWVAANMLQAEDRAHRIGQTKGLQILYPVLTASLDANLCHKIAKKLEQYDRALNTSASEEEREAYLKKITEEDEFAIVTPDPAPVYETAFEPYALLQ